MEQLFWQLARMGLYASALVLVVIVSIAVIYSALKSQCSNLKSK